MSFLKYYHLFTQFRSQVKIIWNVKIMHKDTMLIIKIEKNESSIRKKDVQSVTEILLTKIMMVWWNICYVILNHKAGNRRVYTIKS